MADCTDLLRAIKKASIDAIENNVPVAIVTGTVISNNPIKIQVDQKLILTQTQIVLTRNVTDFKRDETVDHMTERAVGGSHYALFESHQHQYKGRKEFKIHNKLEAGDVVLMIREQGGKHYYVIDRIAK